MILKQLLEQISLFADKVRTLKEEKEAIELSLESCKARISELETENSSLKEQILSLNAGNPSLNEQILSLKEQILSLNAENSSLKEQANLNLIKVQEIVDELKEILSKE